MCASEKGKPVVRRGRKAHGPPSLEVAGLSNSRGGAIKLRPYKEEWVRMRPDSSDIVHARLALQSSNRGPVIIYQAALRNGLSPRLSSEFRS